MNQLSSIHHTNFNCLYELTSNYNKATLLDKLIYWWQISNYTLGDEKIWFTRSIEQIASDSKISQRSVERYLKEFKEAGYIEKTSKLFKKKNLYIRITEKLLQKITAVKYPNPIQVSVETNLSSSDLDKRPNDCVFLKQNGGTDPAILAESSYKEKDNNYLTNYTVPVLLAVEQPKKEVIKAGKYPVFKVESLMGTELDEKAKNYIKGTLLNLQEQHQVKISCPEQLFAEVVFTVVNKEQLKGVGDFKHRVQIIAKLLREKRWLTPKGFYNHADFSQRFKLRNAEGEGGTKTRSDDRKNYKENQATKKLRMEVSELNSMINSETRFLSEATENWQQKQLGSQILLDSIAKKLAGLSQQRSSILQELHYLERAAERTYTILTR